MLESRLAEKREIILNEIKLLKTLKSSPRNLNMNHEKQGANEVSKQGTR
jgi:hypothetical protein